MFRFVIALLVAASYCTAQPVPQRIIKQPSDYEGRQKAEEALAAQLQQDPNNVELLLRAGAMKMDDAQPDEAQSFYERAVAVDPNNVPALYNLAILGWSRVFAELRTARAQLAMEPETPGPLRDRSVRAVLSAKYSRSLDDSIADLQRVLEIDPQNNDSMAYLNLLFRSKADLEETSDAYKQDIATADEWVRKALETARAKQAAGTPLTHLGGVLVAAPPPPPPPPPPAAPGLPATTQRIRVGGNVMAANLVHKVDPVYPPLAQQAQIQGTVRFDAVIAKDGTIQNLTVTSGHPMLVQAALEAVKQWLYKPIMLNGQAVEVATTIEVTMP